jgi:hypothetical protein
MPRWHSDNVTAAKKQFNMVVGRDALVDNYPIVLLQALLNAIETRFHTRWANFTASKLLVRKEIIRKRASFTFPL